MTAMRMGRRYRQAAPILLAAAAWMLAAALLWRTRVPADLELPSLEPGDFFTARHLERTADFERFARVNWLLSTLVLLAAGGAMALLGPRLSRRIGLGRCGTGIVLAVITLTVASAVTLPFALAAEWWDRRHGLSSVAYGEVLTTAWIGLLIEITIAVPVVALVVALATRFPRRWWLLAALLFSALAVGFVALGGLLFLDADRLGRPLVARDARVLAREIGAEGTPVRVDEVSDETTRANALAVGVGPLARVVLWDTLLDGRFRLREIRVVLGHEFAHVVRDHLWKGVAWFALFAFPGAWLISALTRSRGGLADPGLVPLAMLLLLVLQLVTAPLANAVSRRYEAEADWIALEATRDPAGAIGLFRRFSTTALGQPDPPAWSYLFLETHPTLMQRIAMAGAWRDREATSVGR